jgi:hypothetical protein
MDKFSFKWGRFREPFPAGIVPISDQKSHKDAPTMLVVLNRGGGPGVAHRGPRHPLDLS